MRYEDHKKALAEMKRKKIEGTDEIKDFNAFEELLNQARENAGGPGIYDDDEEEQ